MTFPRVRVHSGPAAEQSAREVNAHAYTVGHKIVLGKGESTLGTQEGRRLIAHELTHVVQQASTPISSPFYIAGAHSTSENEAETTAAQLNTGQEVVPVQSHAPVQIARQIGNAPTQTAPVSTPTVTSSPFKVCARALQISPHGNHAYIEAPPFRYAIISPTCPARWYNNPLTGTGGQKWDNSPDPCDKKPTCLDCNPAPGVTDVGKCLRDAFTTYNNPSLYRLLGPNSNTFAGTLARTCCAGMVPKPAALGWVPGWDHAPAPARPTPSEGCPPGPTCGKKKKKGKGKSPRVWTATSTGEIKPDAIILIEINLPTATVKFTSASGSTFHGDIDTDLAPGEYRLTANKKTRRWGIHGSRPGLRFYLTLRDGKDAWEMDYSPNLHLRVV